MGDLISREALIEVIGKSTYVTSTHFGKNDRREWIDRNRVFAVIKGAPAVDAEPVRRGKWLKGDLTGVNPYMASCSECRKLGLFDWVCCPHCGAKMENYRDKVNESLRPD